MFEVEVSAAVSEDDGEPSKFATFDLTAKTGTDFTAYTGRDVVFDLIAYTGTLITSMLLEGTVVLVVGEFTGTDVVFVLVINTGLVIVILLLGGTVV